MTVGAIDIVMNPFTPQEMTKGQTGYDENFMAQIRMPEDMRSGLTIERHLEIMDAAQVDHALLIAVRAGDPLRKGSFEIPYAQVADYVAAHPTRFSGLAGVDPTRGMQQLYDLEEAVREYGFVGAHSYPHWFSLPPDAPQWYPIYAKCCELDIPIMMQVGQNLIYQKDVRLPSVARPILLDRIAIDFPELKLIGIHVGTPWADEMIAMAWKHANVFIGIDAYAPKHLPKSLIRYMDSYGSDKVLFGTDWPVIDPRRGRREVEEFGLREESFRQVMRDNALAVFPSLAARMRG
ncbi:amidohydrolase [Parasphingopyxis algicola]|uniref:amidohydrolase family protein n=1 Tax=Parasphingopyxis algicola TaxID=2026624 RepID=UPI0015A28DD6|nr:amidohydrolase family protein [Parasphingopyxis algicola]QLC26016.1 amidohydrolase [Parasphingopyxis algicola]